MAIHKKATDAQQSIVTIQQKIAAAQQKIAKIQQKIASAQQTVTSAQQEILSTNRHGGHSKAADPNPDTLFRGKAKTNWSAIGTLGWRLEQGNWPANRLELGLVPSFRGRPHV